MSQATYAECNHASDYAEAVCLTCGAHWCGECDLHLARYAITATGADTRPR